MIFRIMNSIFFALFLILAILHLTRQVLLADYQIAFWALLSFALLCGHQAFEHKDKKEG